MHCLVALAAAVAVLSAAAAPTRPLVPPVDAAAMARSCDDGLARHRRTIAAMQARRDAGAIFSGWNRLQIEMENVINPIYLLGSVHPDNSVREAAEPCLQKYTTLSTELYQNEKLYARVSSARTANAHQAKLKKDLVEAFEDSGVALPPGKRARAKEIFDRLESCARRSTATCARIDQGASSRPRRWRAAGGTSAQKRRQRRQLRLGWITPQYLPFMTATKIEPARLRYFIAKLNEGAWRISITCTKCSSCARNWPGSTACPRLRTTGYGARWCARRRR